MADGTPIATDPASAAPRRRVVIVVRGDDLDPATARQQATEFRRRYPDWERWGLSAYYARNADEVADLAADQLERFPELLVYSVAALVAAAIEVVPSFRTPHVTLAFTGELEDGLSRLGRANHDRRPNPYHVP